ncbi:MAG: GNAT family N-acetyltransferase [Planctomycetaceae bacterium]|nr:GNAT family N-acetyltransferase [Planctomycetaceae bacterium]
MTELIVHVDASAKPLPFYEPCMTAIRSTVEPNDRVAVRRLVESTGFFRPDEADIAVELVDEHLRRGSTSGYFFLFAEESGEVAGYVCYGPIGCTVGSYDVYWIVVSPQHQGQGLGRALLIAAETAMQQGDARKIYVETSGREQYEPTRQFYLRCGYVVEAILPDYYDVGDDKVILVKSL